MPSLLTAERKTRQHIAVKEFNDELLNLVTRYNMKCKSLTQFGKANIRNR